MGRSRSRSRSTSPVRRKRAKERDRSKRKHRLRSKSRERRKRSSTSRDRELRGAGGSRRKSRWMNNRKSQTNPQFTRSKCSVLTSIIDFFELTLTFFWWSNVLFVSKYRFLFLIINYLRSDPEADRGRLTVTEGTAHVHRCHHHQNPKLPKEFMYRKLTWKASHQKKSKWWRRWAFAVSIPPKARRLMETTKEKFTLFSNESIGKHTATIILMLTFNLIEWLLLFLLSFFRQYMNRKGGFNRPLDFVA